MPTTVHVEKDIGVVNRQGLNLASCYECVLSRIGHNPTLFSDNQNMIKWLHSADVTRLFVWSGIAGVNVHDQPLKGIIPVFDNLPKPETGSVFSILHFELTQIPHCKMHDVGVYFQLVSWLCRNHQFNLKETGATFGRPF